MPGYAITEEQSRLLGTAVSDLAVQSEADAVLLTDYGGNVVAEYAREQNETVQTVAALAAGSFSATRELARLIGEPPFSSISHQGQNYGIYIHNLASQFLVLVVFSRKTTTGLVKLYVERAAVEMEAVLRVVYGQTSATHGSPASFEMDEAGRVFRKGVQK